MATFVKIFALSSAFFVVNCSTAGSNTASTPSAAAAAISSANLWKSFSSIPTAKVNASFQMLQGLSPARYSELTKSLGATSTNVAIDGHGMQNLLGSASNLTKNVDALNAAYPTVGSYWKSIGITSAAFTQGQFQTAVQNIEQRADAANGVKSLALADSTDQFKTKDGCNQGQAQADIQAAFGDNTLSLTWVIGKLNRMADYADTQDKVFGKVGNQNVQVSDITDALAAWGPENYHNTRLDQGRADALNECIVDTDSDPVKASVLDHDDSAMDYDSYTGSTGHPK